MNAYERNNAVKVPDIGFRGIDSEKQWQKVLRVVAGVTDLQLSLILLGTSGLRDLQDCSP